MRAGRRWGAAVIAAGALFALTASGAAAIPTYQPSANVSAFSAPHRQLSANPVLRSGQVVLVVVTGFAARATVTVQLVRTGLVRHVAADLHGVVRLSYAARPCPPGRQCLLTFQGRPQVRGGNQQALIVTVPRIGLFPYRLGANPPSGGSGVGGISVDVPDNGSGSGLAVTGTQAIGALALAMLACITGVALLRLGRRRRP